MQGLLKRGQQPPGQPAQPGAQPPTQPAQAQPVQPGQQPGQDQQGAPREQTVVADQKAYDLATSQMLKFVYDQNGIDTLTQSIQSTGDPQKAMARLLGRLLTMTVQSAMMAGKRIAPDLIFQGAIEVIRAISEVAQAQGLLDPKREKEVAEAAFFDGLALFATEARSEALTDQERQRYVELLDMVEQLDQQGAMPKGNAGGQRNEREAQA